MRSLISVIGIVFFAVLGAGPVWAASFGGPDNTDLIPVQTSPSNFPSPSPSVQPSPKPSPPANPAVSPAPVASASPAAQSGSTPTSATSPLANTANGSGSAQTSGPPIGGPAGGVVNADAKLVEGASFYVSAEQDFALSIDAKDFGSTPAFIKGLAAGNHELIAKTPEGLTWKTILKVNAAAAGSVLIFVPHLSTSGSLAAESSPPGAELFIDGVSKGRTPVTVGQIASGKHNISLAAQNMGFGPESVEIESGKTLQRLFNLERVTKIVFDPPLGSSVLVEIVDQAGDSRLKQFASETLSVTRGTFTIRLSAEGNKNWQKQITAKGEENLKVDTSGFIKPAKITLQTLPAGIHIAIDGTDTSASALAAGVTVPIGAHLVAISDDKGKYRSVSLVLAEASVTDLKAELAGFQSSPSLNLGAGSASAPGVSGGSDATVLIVSLVGLAVGTIFNLDQVAASMDGTWSTYETVKYASLGLMGASAATGLVWSVVSLASSAPGGQ